MNLVAKRNIAQRTDTKPEKIYLSLVEMAGSANEI